jgi:hypothetical protein
MNNASSSEPSMPPTPWTANTSSESSILSRFFTAWMAK